MSSRIAFRFQAVSLLGLFHVLAGCGGSDCEKAADRLAECLDKDSVDLPGAAQGTSSSTSSVAQTCDGQKECVALCINEATCDDIKIYDSTPMSNDVAQLRDCLAKCNSVTK